MELGEYDLMLGVDWMRNHSPITHDFDANIITIKLAGKMVEFKGMDENVSLKMWPANHSLSWYKEGGKE